MKPRETKKREVLRRAQKSWMTITRLTRIFRFKSRTKMQEGIRARSILQDAHSKGISQNDIHPLNYTPTHSSQIQPVVSLRRCDDLVDAMEQRREMKRKLDKPTRRSARKNFRNLRDDFVYNNIKREPLRDLDGDDDQLGVDSFHHVQFDRKSPV